MAAAKAIGVLTFVIVLGRVVLRPIYRMVAETRSSELFIATTLLVVLGTGWLMSLVGISMVLGAFLAGLLLSETEYKHQVGTDIRPFRGILLGLFFMTVGMSINLQLIQTEWLQVSFIVVALLLLKSTVTAILCRLFGLKTDTSVRAGLFLSQGGEFGFILFMTAAGLGLLSNEIAQVLLAAVTLTMIATPLMALLGSHLSTLLREDDNDPTHNITNADVELHDHVVIAGFGRVGETVATVLSAANVPYVALEIDARRVATYRAKGLPVYFGDASQIAVLNSAGASLARGVVVTIDQHAQADLIVTNLRDFFPGLPIIVRAKDLSHVRHLENRGATQAVPEALEASLQLGANAMTAIGVRPDEIMEVIQELRDDDYAILNKATKN
jgi:CPA2 family monovalent cation:H+ antiporter-2